MNSNRKHRNLTGCSNSHWKRFILTKPKQIDLKLLYLIWLIDCKNYLLIIGF